MIRPTDPASPARSSSPKIADAIAPIDPQDAHHGGLSRRQWWWRKTALPLLTSLSLHAGIVVIGLLCFTAYKVINRPTDDTREKVVPESKLVEDDIHDTLGGKSALDIPLPPMPKVGIASNEKFDSNKGPVVAPSGSKLDSLPDDNVINAFQTSRHSANPNNQPGGPDDLGTPRLVGTGGIFNPSGGPGGGPGGDGTRTKPPAGPLPTSTAYVCDASGSMMEKMPALRRELSNAVMRLRPWQEFSILFFQDEQFTALSPNLVRAIPENKKAAESFVDDLSPHGTTDPIPGIKKAFAQHPQIMFLLTDGDFPNNDAVLAEIRSLEKQQHVVIHTIAFTGDADHDTKFLVLLKQVAQETGGTFKKVDVDSLEGN